MQRDSIPVHRSFLQYYLAAVSSNLCLYISIIYLYKSVRFPEVVLYTYIQYVARVLDETLKINFNWHCLRHFLTKPNPMFDHLLESSRWDDSKKWSNIGFAEEIDILEIKICTLSGPMCGTTVIITYRFSLDQMPSYSLMRIMSAALY